MTHLSRNNLVMIAILTIAFVEIDSISRYYSLSETFGDLKSYATRNLVTEEKEEDATPLRFRDYDIGGPCIVLLVTDEERSLENAKSAVMSLALLSDNNSRRPAPLLIFSKEIMDRKDKEEIRKLTRRPVAFPKVVLTKLPDGFILENEDEKLIKGDTSESEWTHHHIVKFWIWDIWNHPSTWKFSTITRISPGSCFNELNNEQIPFFKKDNLVYHSQYYGYENDKSSVRGLFAFAETYMKIAGHYPSNPLLWRFIKNIWENDETLPVFNTRFETTRKSWMQHPDIERWHKALLETPPYEIFRHHWSEAAIRFLTAAMFAPNFRIDTSAPQGFSDNIRCSTDDIRQTLSMVYG